MGHISGLMAYMLYHGLLFLAPVFFYIFLKSKGPDNFYLIVLLFIQKQQLNEIGFYDTLLTKLRKIIGWTLIIISTILMFISIFIATTGELLKGGGIYVASQLTWYPGLALLGPEIVQKSKEIWNNFIHRIKNGFTQK